MEILIRLKLLFIVPRRFVKYERQFAPWNNVRNVRPQVLSSIDLILGSLVGPSQAMRLFNKPRLEC